MSDTDRAEQQRREALERHDARVRRRQTVRLTVLGVLAAMFAGVALDNTQDVSVGWVLGDASVPLIVAMLGSFVVGAILGVLGRRHRNQPTAD